MNWLNQKGAFTAWWYHVNQERWVSKSVLQTFSPFLSSRGTSTKPCRDSVGDCSALSTEAELLHTVLIEINENLIKRELGVESTERLTMLGKGCQAVLTKLYKELTGYDALRKDKQTFMARLHRGKKRIQWAMESPGEIRQQLLTHISLLALFNSSLAASISK